jgi:hypothetical protein
MLAQAYGRSRKVPSLVLACEKSNPLVHKHYSMLYRSQISRSSLTTPPLELFPARNLDTIREGPRTLLDNTMIIH